MMVVAEVEVGVGCGGLWQHSKYYYSDSHTVFAVSLPTNQEDAGGSYQVGGVIVWEEFIDGRSYQMGGVTFRFVLRHDFFKNMLYMCNLIWWEELPGGKSCLLHSRHARWEELPVVARPGGHADVRPPGRS